MINSPNLMQDNKTGFRKEPVFKYLLFLMSVLSFLSVSLQVNAADRLQQWKNPLPVIVIDPGHGGENEGTTENNHIEKNMTMLTALSMYQELSKYDDLEVYLTHTDDIDMTIKSRAKFASDLNADLLISIHYNASVDHDLFGAEAWIPYEYPLNNYAYQFAYEFLTPLQEKGIFIRGIKTKLNDKGLDYYGILRESAAFDIPAVILEHCHVDEPRDEIYCATEEDCIQFGKLDAQAVLNYVRGENLQPVSKDYAPFSTYVDTTPPDICSLEFLSADESSGLLSFNVSSTDYDSCLIYYDYSLDNGESFSVLQPWPHSNALTGEFSDTFTLNVTAPDGSSPIVIVRAYNLFDLSTESNKYYCPIIFQYKDLVSLSTASDSKSTDSISDSNSESETKEIFIKSVQESADKRLSTFLLFSLIFSISILIIVYISQLKILIKKRKRNHNKKQNKPT